MFRENKGCAPRQGAPPAAQPHHTQLLCNEFFRFFNLVSQLHKRALPEERQLEVSL